jgi:hypothetical protein
VNSKVFWFQHPKLISLINQQTQNVLNFDDEAYKQCLMDMLSTIEELKVALGGDELYKEAKEIFCNK